MYKAKGNGTKVVPKASDSLGKKVSILESRMKQLSEELRQLRGMLQKNAAATRRQSNDFTNLAASVKRSK